jgi:hypothetical protein
MFLTKSLHITVVVATCAIMIACIIGCGKNDDSSQESSPSVRQDVPAFTLDYDNTEKPQILTSKLFFDSISITRYHIGQDQPIEYSARDLSKVVLYNVAFPDTHEWMLSQIDVHFKDGSVKSEHPIKVWNVYFRLTSGKESRPVPIEQHFSRK